MIRELQNSAMTARTIVDKLHGTLGLYHNVIDTVESDTILYETVRKVALQIANARLGGWRKDRMRDNNE